MTTVRQTDRQPDRQNREIATEIGAEAGNEVTATAADCPQSDRERERRYRCICTIVPLRSMAQKVVLHCRFKEKDCVQLLERLPHSLQIPFPTYLWTDLVNFQQL